MSKFTFTQPRATLEETLAFANAVREAGGGNPLDALMPAVPVDSSQCLIARNLNFNCVVGVLHWYDDSDDDPSTGEGWYMHIDDETVADRIAAATGMKKVWDGPSAQEIESGEYKDDGDWVLELPTEIGMVAYEFDHWSDVIGCKYGALGSPEYFLKGLDAAPEAALQRLQDFWPFVDASAREAFKNATFVNDKGELVL